jgi:hypothetical protein
MKIRLYILIILSLIGCSQHPVLLRDIKVDTIKIVSPTIEDTLDAKRESDSLIYGEKIIKKDTVVIVKYYPYSQKIYVKAKPDTVRIIKIDTVAITKLTDKTNSDKRLLEWITIIFILVFIYLIVKKIA